MTLMKEEDLLQKPQREKKNITWVPIMKVDYKNNLGRYLLIHRNIKRGMEAESDV